MLKCCLKCKKDTENVDSKILKTKNGRTLLSSKCAVCGSKKSRFMKEQEGKGLLNSLGDLDKAFFNMIWLMVNRKIWLKEQNQIKC